MTKGTITTISYIYVKILEEEIFHIITDVGNAPYIQASQLDDKEISNLNIIASHNMGMTPNNI